LPFAIQDPSHSLRQLNTLTSTPFSPSTRNISTDANLWKADGFFTSASKTSSAAAQIKDMTQTHNFWKPEEVQNSVQQQSTAVFLTLLIAFVATYVFCSSVFPLPLEGLLRPFIYQLMRMASKVSTVLTASSVRHSVTMKSLFGHGPNSLVRKARTLSSTSLGLQASSGDSFAPAGLRNWDNSCFQNSVLQGLASLPSLSAYLEDVVQKYPDLGHTDESTNGTLRELLKKLAGNEVNGCSFWTPEKLKSMNTWQQQDAQEYYSKVLDELEKEIARAAKHRKSAVGLEAVVPAKSIDHGKKISLDAEERNGDVSPAQTLPVTNPLEGFLAQRVGCMRCGYSECLSMIPFNCLTVSLGCEWGYDIRECLDEYTKLEEIDGVECPKCTLLRAESQIKKLLDMPTTTETFRNSASKRLNTITQALNDEDFTDATLMTQCQIPKKNWVATTKSKQAVIGRASRSLIIHVNRSMFDEMTGAQLKNSAHVRFPAKLDLKPWCLGTTATTSSADKTEQQETWSMDPRKSIIPEDASTSPMVYEIKAIITHYGHHENGHYICYRQHTTRLTPDNGEPEGKEKRLEKQWWRLSDDDVTPVSEEQVLAHSDVFMLFYEQVEGTEVAEAVTSGADQQSLNEQFNTPAVAVAAPLKDFPEDLLDEDTTPQPQTQYASAADAVLVSIAEDETSQASKNRADQDPDNEADTAPLSQTVLYRTASPLAMRTAGLPHQAEDSLSSLRMAEAF